jgi:hypothetical protein
MDLVNSSRLGGQMWGITTYFNPAHYANKINHLARFSMKARGQGLKLAIVEVAFNDDPFVVDQALGDLVIRVKSSSVMWQKERLLNIAVSQLPAECDKIAWLDADLIFENESWVEDTSRLLDSFVIVQPYDLAWWLPRGVDTPSKEWRAENFLQVMHGFAFTQGKEHSHDFPIGHWGFAWAARRTLIESNGFYDRLILGGGDLAMAWAMYDDEFCFPSEQWLDQLGTPSQIEDLVAWKNRFYRDVKGSVSYVKGSVYHYWHGTIANRAYTTRQMILKNADFDPKIDIQLDENGCWKWSTSKPNLHKEVMGYFWSRREESR